MSRITVELPSMLRSATGLVGPIEIEAATLAGALEALFAAHPVLRVHLVDETGSLRPHVLCFHNSTDSRWLDPAQCVLRDGDVVRFLQAVSGG